MFTDQKSEMRRITPSELRFGPGESTPVVSGAQKFILPVPAGGPGGGAFVFFNAKDQSWQAAGDDGEGVIIINDVTAEQAARLDAKVRSLEPDPERLTRAQLEAALAFARDDLGLGDMYNSTRSFVASRMTPAAAYGPVKRDAAVPCQAVYIPVPFTFEGPALTPQVFPRGGVIVKQGDEFRGVQPDSFLRTYRLADGRPLASLAHDLKTFV